MPSFERLVEIVLAAERASAQDVTVVDFFASNGGEAVGRVAAERGRICWAVARSQSPTISDLFAEEAGISSSELEAIFRQARREGRPFGEELVSRRIVGDEELRRCLRRQIATALLSLSDLWKAGGTPSWSASTLAQMSYDSSFTLSPMQVLEICATHSPGLGEDAEGVPAIFSRFVHPLASALCFRDTGRRDLPLVPIAAVNVEEMGLGTALAIGREAMAVARPAALLAASIQPYAILVHDEGRGVLCAQARPHLCVFEIADRAHYGELLACLLAQSR